MKNISYLAMAIAMSLLVACGHSKSKNDTAKLSVDDLGSGRYTVSIGDENSPSVGKYYGGSGNSRFVFVEGANGNVAKIYRRKESGEWTAVPNIIKDSDVNFINSTPVLDQGVGFKVLPSSFVTKTFLDKIVTLSIASNGKLTAEAGDCYISGEMSDGDIEELLEVRLTTENCNLPQVMDGVLIIDKDYQPAVFKLVAYDDQEVFDLMLYQE